MSGRVKSGRTACPDQRGTTGVAGNRTRIAGKSTGRGTNTPIVDIINRLYIWGTRGRKRGGREERRMYCMIPY